MRFDYKMIAEGINEPLFLENDEILEQMPHKFRVQRNRTMAFGMVSKEIELLGLTDNQSIVEKAILPLSEKHEMGWGLLEELLYHFAPDLSKEEIEDVVVPVRTTQLGEFEQELEKWEAKHSI